MKYFRFALSHLLFFLGDCVSRLMRPWFRDMFDTGFLYPIYNKLMIWSSQVQGASGFGPWSETNQSEVAHEKGND